MGKTRDLFKKIRDTKGAFHAKMGAIKNRNVMDLTEAEDIKKRWQASADEWIRKLWYIYTMEYYSAIKKNSFESVLMRWM